MYLYNVINWLRSKSLNLLKRLGLSKASPTGGGDSRPLVRQRPISLETRYVPVQRGDEVERLFGRLNRRIFGEIDRSEQARAGFGAKLKPKMIRESGRLPGYRPYFFVQPLNHDGWLFERSETGWVISQARKIVQANTFMRAYENWDIVTVYEPNDGQGTIRLTSKRFEDNLVSFSVYEQKMLKSLELS